MSDRPGEMDERDVDARFASIVAAWDESHRDEPRPDPTADPETYDAPAPDGDGPITQHAGAGAEQDVAEQGPGTTSEQAGTDPDTEADPGTGTDPAAADHRPPWVNPSPLDLVVPASTWRVPTGPGLSDGGPTGPTPAADRDEEHFEPPPVTLPPQEDLHFWGAVIGLVGGPLLLLYVAMARPFHSERWFAAGVVLSLAGFALMVLRQPRHRDPTDGDDGARV